MNLAGPVPAPVSMPAPPPVSKPNYGYSQATHPAVVEDDPAGGFAVTGFALSLASFLVILLAPIALVISVMGLRSRRNFGLAVGGTVISGLQNSALVLFVVFMLLVGRVAWFAVGEAREVVGRATQKLQEEQDRQATRRAIQSAAERLDRRALELGKRLSEEEGSRAVGSMHDRWGKALRYSVNDGEPATYSLASSGPDQLSGNSDDIAMLVPTPIPQTQNEALALLRNSVGYRREAGLDWALRAQPEDPAANRSAMVDAVLPLLAVSSLKSKARDVLVRWTTIDEHERLLAALEQRSSIDGGLVVEVLAARRDEAAVLSLLNHSTSRVRSVVTRVLRQWDVDESRQIEQCVQDLSRGDRLRSSLARLQSFSIEDSQQQAEVSQALFRVALNRSLPVRDREDAVSLAAQLGEDTVEELINVYENTSSSRAQELLVASDDPRVVRHFLASMNETGASVGRATMVLSQMPEAESAIVDAMEGASVSFQSLACGILAKIGGDRSIPVLEGLVDEPIIGARARDALIAIRQRATPASAADPDASPPRVEADDPPEPSDAATRSPNDK